MNEEDVADSGLETWAILEIMGRHRVAGKISEAVIAGVKLLRVDVPAVDGDPAMTQFYGAQAIYCLTPVSEELGRRAAGTLRPCPIRYVELRHFPQPAQPELFDDAAETAEAL